MKNRFATGIVAIATSAAVFGSGIAVADEDTAAEQQTNSSSSVSQETIDEMNADLKADDDKYDASKNPVWLVILKYINLFIETIAKQLKPIFSVAEKIK